MKKKHFVTSSVQICISLFLIALLNFDILLFSKEVVSEGSGADAVTTMIYGKYSIIDIIKFDPLLVIIITVAIILNSVLISSVSMLTRNLKLWRVSHVFFACSLLSFMLLLGTAFLFGQAAFELGNI